MPREDGAPVYRTPVKTQQPQPQRGRGYGVPAWIKPQAKKQKDDVADEPTPRPTQPTRYNPTGAATQPFTPPAWWNNLSNRVGNWIDNNVSGSQYVPAGLSQPQRPTTAAQFTRPAWIGGNQAQVSEPSNPSLPTGTFFAGGSTQDGTRLVPTGQNTSTLLGGGGIRNRGTVRIAKGSPMIGDPRQPTSTTTNNGGGWGTTYKKKGGGGYSYSSPSYSDRAPSWLMNLTNWNFKG